MARQAQIAALDIGTTKLCCFIARTDTHGETRVVGIGHQIAHGLRNGSIIDMEAAAEHGVKVVDVSNIAPANPVAEWNLALILMCLRYVGTLFRQMMEVCSSFVKPTLRETVKEIPGY